MAYFGVFVLGFVSFPALGLAAIYYVVSSPKPPEGYPFVIGD